LALRAQAGRTGAVLRTVFVTGSGFVFETATDVLEKTGTNVKEDV
jgi:hypothetical protein